jgi:hypothetical protein
VGPAVAVPARVLLGRYPPADLPPAEHGRGGGRADRGLARGTGGRAGERGTRLLGVLARLLAEGKVTGPAVHDARIAALCLANGVRELWSADRDFSRFPDLRTANPLV